MNDKKWPTIVILIWSLYHDNACWRRKIKTNICALVRFHFTLQFSQQCQNLSTNLHVWKERSIIGQKGLGRGKALKEKKKEEKVPVKVNNHGYPAWYTLICGPVQRLFPHPDSECVKCISICMYIFQHTFYLLLSDRRVKLSRGSTWSNEETEFL